MSEESNQKEKELEGLSELNAADKEKELEGLSELNAADSEDIKDLSSFLDEFLMHQSPELQRQVRKTVEIFNINHDDPFFLILLQCRITQILYETTPNRIEKAFRIGEEELIFLFDRYKEKLLKIQQETFAKYEEEQGHLANIRLRKAVARVLEDNNLNSRGKNKLSPRVAGSLVTAATVVLGSILAFGVGTQFNNSAIAQTWKQELEAEDRVLLAWAKSEEGQTAKDIVDWNEDLIDQSCQQKVKGLGIVFQIGSAKLTDGFCVLFTEPPNERNYR